MKILEEKNDTPIKLSNDELAMVNAYFECNMNGTRAYMKLHPKSSYDAARSSAAAVLSKPNIKAEITRRLEEGAISHNEVVYRLGAMSRAEMYPFIKIDDDGFVYFNFADPQAEAFMFLIKKIKTKRERRVEGKGEDAETWEGEWVEVELHDSQKALELMGKYYRMFGDKEEKSADVETKLFSIPAELIAPDFLASHRAVLSGKYNEFVEKGGRGSTKSSFVSIEIVSLLVNDPDANALATRQVKDTLRDSVYAQLVWAIGVLGFSEKFKCTTSPLEIEYLPTGQQIFFRGADDPGKIKSIKPKKGAIKILWFEELDSFRGAEVVRNIEQSAIRGTDTAYIFKSFNPPRTKQNWANKYCLIPKEKQWQHNSDYLTVPAEWLGRVFIEEAEHIKSVNLPVYEHEYLGYPNFEGGSVFQNIELRPITNEEISKFDRVGQGIDWGWYPDPFAWTRSYYDPAHMTLYIFDEWRVNRKSNEETYNFIFKDKDGKHAPQDELIIADSNENKSIGDYRAYGAHIRGAEKSPGSRNYSYKWLQSRLKIVIDPIRAPNSANEFSDAEYPQDKDGNYINEYPETNDHFIDSTRYRTNLLWFRNGQ